MQPQFDIRPTCRNDARVIHSISCVSRYLLIIISFHSPGGVTVLRPAMGSAGSKKLPKEDMDFLMENTNFTKQQIKAWYSGFMVR